MDIEEIERRKRFRESGRRDEKGREERRGGKTMEGKRKGVR